MQIVGFLTGRLIFFFRFLPRLPKSALEQSLDEAGIVKVESAEHSIDAIEKSVTCKCETKRWNYIHVTV